MAQYVFGTEVQEILGAAQQTQGKTTIQLGDTSFTLPKPFQSPTDWRDCTIYFLLLDRFNNTSIAPVYPWNQKTMSRQGGTFKGATAKLQYIKDLGANAVWISPVLKNPCEAANMSYPGYATQDFINLDKRFASDGTLPTAEKEYRELIDTAHSLGIYVIQDIVINHTAQVFDYVINGNIIGSPDYLNRPLGQEPPIDWFNGLGFARTDWQDQIPPGTVLSPDDVIWPAELQNKVFFRRQGNKSSDTPNAQGFVPGDFGTMRQLVAEYDATPASQAAFRKAYGEKPVLSILVESYQYLIAKYDVDGFRIDTVKYVRPDIVEEFCNSMREFALSVGKQNFFTFGEIWDSNATINRFVGRHSSDVDAGGLDAALDYPLFYALPNAVKAQSGVEQIKQMFDQRITEEENLVSSHAEAGRYFVSFIDNHDQNQRFHHPLTPAKQVTQALACLYMLQGIPCLYYGTEQGLTGTVDASGRPVLDSLESVREALWGKQWAQQPDAFDQSNSFYSDIKAIIAVRNKYRALRYGRLYFREVSGDGSTFGFSSGVGGLIAFSRVLSNSEVVTIANTNPTTAFTGFVLVDLDLNRSLPNYQVAYSNFGTVGAGAVQLRSNVACLYVVIQPMEVQILAVA